MKNFRFAIMGAGNISNRFCDAVSRVEGCEVVAVASKSCERASEFAERNHVPAAYGDYGEMLRAEKPDCVYIGTVPSSHFELAMLCLDDQVPVLCEKAMFQNSAEAEKVFERSRKEQIFVMEALWSRFLPAVKEARTWVEEGKIGTPVYCDTSIGFLAPQGDENRYYNAALGGGAARDILVYAYELTTYLLTEPVENVHASAVWGPTGVDLTDHVVLRFPEMLASLTTSFIGAFEDHVALYGSEGKIVIPNPHFASEAFLYDKEDVPVAHFRDQVTENGFTYEIGETMRCIRAGLYESPVVPHQSTLDCAKVFDLVDKTGGAERM